MTTLKARARTYRSAKNAGLRSHRDVSLAVTLFITLVVLSALYLAKRFNWSYHQAYRYLCLLPLFYAAYRYGLKPALALSVFLSAALLPELFLNLLWYGFATPTLDLVVLVLFINIFAYVVAEMSTSIRTQEAMAEAVHDWETVIATSLSLNEVIGVILKQARKTCGAQASALLLRNPVDTQWEMITPDLRIPLQFVDGPERNEQNLAQWLLAQESSLILHRLDQDPRFETKSSSANTSISSLLARPLRHRDRALMGMLLLFGQEPDEFTANDQQALDELVSRGEQALEQAGLQAQTDHTLARRVKQLAAIQFTVRVLNATLEPAKIIEQTLDCALEITNGDAGLVCLCAKDLPPISRVRGASQNHVFGQSLAQVAEITDRPTVLSSTESRISPLLPGSQSQLLAPIRRRGRDFGHVLVEGAEPQLFGEIDLDVLGILTDHAAIALENAQLFREIRKEKERVSLIIHSVADGLFTTDQNRRILTLNPAAEELTGWKAEESVGRYCWEILRCVTEQNSCQESCPLLQAIQEGRFVHDEKFVIRQRLGIQRVVSLSAAPLRGTDDRPHGAAGLLRDITKQEETDRLQREFIAAISHELRGPLCNIGATAELMKAEFEGMEADGHLEYLDSLLTQSQRLTRFADSLLDLFQLETGHIALQARPIPVSFLLEEIVQNWHHVPSGHAISIDVPEPSPWIWADEKGIQVVLNNLIENAIKYSPPGSTIGVGAQPGPDGTTIIAVQDHGQGIAPQHQVRLFERFYRVNGSDSQTVYGQGLGLYIARKLIETMGGQIWVESEEGRGSKFAFALPMLEESNEGNATRC